MDKNKNQQKLNMWKKQAVDIEKQLNETMQKRGEAAKEGDLRENGAYQYLTEEAEMLSARLANIQKIIQGLEKED